MSWACPAIAQRIAVASAFQAGFIIENIRTISPYANNNEARFQVTSAFINGVLVFIFVALTVIDPDAHAVFPAQQTIDPVDTEKLPTCVRIRGAFLILLFVLFVTNSALYSVFASQKLTDIAMKFITLGH